MSSTIQSSTEENPHTVQRMYSQERFRDRVKRAQNICANLGRKPTAEDILQVSHLNYTSKPDLDHWIDTKIPFEPKKLLDIGSGVGGPARYVAKKVKGEVYALEYLQELHEDAQDLHEFCKEDMEENNASVKYLKGDFLEPSEELVDFDACFSQGVFLHLADKDAIAKRIRACLRPGGHFFIDDYIAVGGRDDFTRKWLNKEYTVPNGELPFKWEYVKALEDNGLQVLEVVDASHIYAKHTWSRFERYLAGDPQTVASYADVPDAMDLFRMQIRTYNQVNFEDYPLAYKEYTHKNEERKRGMVTGVLIYGRRLPSEIDH
mmetsp:Transcript_27757/g.31912  ORF Transcript_27757/g.31912 Transcript_27757/m.31912 type:complete len:319 (+) Transcript_27757:91-1047(+)|eukprot:CAMPEP_0115041026 /NCGR_PEP_ID=MMETSP0216-20121206/45259_1 /TAXON_ID=223996 /ORGANISM="Protocruzia adherens, Strain Boccale" /LENGTH=318 /DNA_ID=CAMNT_0002422539 /DNA_START=28 /DNA_END=984 /DNA_ORIENTATION=+